MLRNYMSSVLVLSQKKKIRWLKVRMDDWVSIEGIQERA